MRTKAEESLRDMLKFDISCQCWYVVMIIFSTYNKHRFYYFSSVGVIM